MHASICASRAGQSQLVRLFFEVRLLFVCASCALRLTKLWAQVQDLKNADGFMGKMTGNVSDPFCEILMQDFRNNSHTTVAEFKVVARASAEFSS